MLKIPLGCPCRAIPSHAIRNPSEEIAGVRST
jgi:hypothetical protein